MFRGAILAPFDWPALAQGAPAVAFTDITGVSGVAFTHINGARGELRLPEVIGAGGALFDYDNDGDLDLLAVQGSAVRSGERREPAPRSRLFRNESSASGRGAVTFTDVTESSRLAVTGYGMGAATGDYDNDGWIDVYVTGLDSNRLLRNRGDGTFVDVTAATGTGDTQWSTSATFFDYNRDGWLDLFVVHYVNFSLEARGCFGADSARDYCNPAVYEPVADRLFRNNGDGTFADVTARAGLLRSSARGLGVLAADFNADGWLDLFVANDGDPNQLWINGGGTGSFTDEALLAGVAVNRHGQAQGSMGIDAADVDGDGDEDVFVTNLDNEGNTLYRNVGSMLYEDRTFEMGLFRLGFTGFGARFLDYDNDSWPDLAVVNGAVRRSRDQLRSGDAIPLRQRSQLYRNDRGGRFADVTARAGPAFASLQVARGLAAGDLDNDGDTDLVVFNNGGPLRMLRNDIGQNQHWLGVRVLEGRRDALHARVTLVARGARRALRRIQVDGSYCASSDPRVLFGLGADTSAKDVQVEWPSGAVEEFRALSVDRYWTLERGKPPRPDSP
jgi:hypothetical protein